MSAVGTPNRRAISAWPSSCSTTQPKTARIISTDAIAAATDWPLSA